MMCTAVKGDGEPCSSLAERTWVNSEGATMALCGRHDDAFYRMSIKAAATDEPKFGEVPDSATYIFLDALNRWSVPAV